MSALHLKLKKAEGEYDFGTSKFLGSPTLPEEWLEDFEESVIFLLQIRLDEIKDLDEDNLLPHTGYLYIFLDTSEGEYNLVPIVRYYPGEPTHVLNEFNGIVDGYEEFIDDYLITFEKCDDGAPGNKLFGVPSDWNYMEESKRLLFQFDPLDSEMGLFDYLDGLFYFFFDEDLKDFSKITLKEEIS